MKTILAPTDFSKKSDNSIDYAVEIAKYFKCKIVLFHVYSSPLIATDAPVVIFPIDSEMEKECYATLTQKENELREKHGKDFTIDKICKSGVSVDEAIKEFCGENPIDLIVMGMSKRGYLNEKILGSTTTSLMKRTQVPVLVINENVRFTCPKNIVLACDYEKIPHKSILEPLTELASLFHSKVYVLNIYNEHKRTGLVKKVNTDKILEHSLDGIIHSFHAIKSEDILEGINKFASEKKADMIVVIPRDHKFPENFFNSRNSKRLAFHSKVALLSLHE